MSYLSFNKEQLVDSNFSFHREFLEANETGAFSSSSISLCNTRKYHGMLVLRQPYISSDFCYVMLACLDETVIHEKHTFHLATHQYPGVLHPQGFSLLTQFHMDKIPTWIYQLGNVTLKKELLLVQNENRLLIRYSYLKGKENIRLKLEPFTSFRNYHDLAKNNRVHRNCDSINNGMSYQMYRDFDALHMQCSKEIDFKETYEWYFDNEYLREMERGYEYKEDLFQPGIFSLNMTPGEEIIFSVGTSETEPHELAKFFNTEFKNRKTIKNFESSLDIAAEQFISKTKKGTEITAGFHWFGRWGRDTFISLPGLTLSRNQPEVCKDAFDTMLQDLQDGLLTNIGVGEEARYNSADASLWFFWALQEYAEHTGKSSELWLSYGDKMKEILSCYKEGTHYNIHMKENGLLWGGQEDVALTWMDAMVDGKPVTPRAGHAVDLNALWYNAICFSLELAKEANDKDFVKEWKAIPVKIKSTFKELFYSKEKGYLADFINEQKVDWSIRPNQVFAISLPYPLIEGSAAKSVLEVVKEYLLTPRGLRTLAQTDSNYKGIYRGDQKERDYMYHQGIVWPWLLGHFCEAIVKIHGDKGLSLVKKIYKGFEDAIFEYGVGSVAEIYDGEAPHKAVGTISQAWSVAELLRIKEIIDQKVKKKV